MMLRTYAANANWRTFALGLVVTGVIVFLIAPIFIVIPMSFSSSRFLQFPPPGWSLRWYQAYLSSSKWLHATRVSLTVASATTLIAVPIGTAAAYGIRNSAAKLMYFVQLVLLAPLAVPVIIIAAGIFFIYVKLHLLYTITGLIFADVLLAIPFVLVAVSAGLQSFDMTQEMVARTLGMNRFRAFWWVTLPQIKASVISGALFAFITSLDEAIIALFISGGHNETLTKVMFTVLRDEIAPSIAVISTLMIAVSLLLVSISAAAGRLKET